MTEDKTFTLQQVHQIFAVQFNNAIWRLLEKKTLSEGETNELINLAHASLLHWSKSAECRKVNIQRGEYMIALAYVTAGRKEPALYHAQRCKQLTEEKENENDDFDLPYALLIMASAARLNGNEAEALGYFKKAQQLGDNIKGEKDKEIFVGDVRSLGW